MSRQSRELKKQQERAKKYGCDGRCYWSTGMCPSVEICDETRVGEAIATAIGLITILAMIAMVPIIVIGGAIMLIWSIFAGQGGKGMENDKIHDYTDAYLESYLRALDKTHNPDLAIQTAMGVTMVLRTIDAQNEPKQPAQPQINPMAALFGAMMQQAAQNQQEEGNPEGSEIESDDDE